LQQEIIENALAQINPQNVVVSTKFKKCGSKRSWPNSNDA
jgi:hypothetical protein